MSINARPRKGRLAAFQRDERRLVREVSLLTTDRQDAAAMILESLPNRIHEVFERYVATTPDSVALVEDGETLTYRQFDRAVSGTTDALREFGIRAGDRVLIVSENCISLTCLLFATSRLDGWAIVANPRLSARELDQIRDHSGARRVFLTADVSEEAAAHTSRLGANIGNIGPLHSVGFTALNEDT